MTSSTEVTKVPAQTRLPSVPPPQTHGPSEVRRVDAKRHGRPLLAFGLCVAVVAAVVLFTRWRDARFVTVVSPIASPSVPQCAATLHEENAGSWAKPCADHLVERQWFHVRVTNVGHSSGNIACSMK